MPGQAAVVSSRLETRLLAEMGAAVTEETKSPTTKVKVNKVLVLIVNYGAGGVDRRWGIVKGTKNRW